MIRRTKSFLFLFSVFVLISLTACSREDDTSLPPTLGEKALSGTIENWTGETATLAAITENPRMSGFVTLTEASINPDGSFNITLPGADEMADKLRTNDRFRGLCTSNDETGTVEVIPSSFEVSHLFMLVFASGDAESPIGEIAYRERSDSERSGFSVSQLYVGSDATVKGTCTYTVFNEDDEQVAITDAYDLELKTGWNDIISSYSESEDGLSASTLLSTGAIPEGGGWRYASLDFE